MDCRAILLVEDNPDDQTLTIRALRKSNVLNEVVIAKDGAEALDYLMARGSYRGKNPPLPAIILLDLNLPKISGLEVLREIRSQQQTKCLPVIILTSSQEEEDVIGSYSLGANSYIRKPVDFTKFVEAVRQLSLYWLVLNELPK